MKTFSPFLASFFSAVIVLSVATAASSAESELATFSSRLPVLVLDTQGSGPLVKDGVDHASSLQVYAPAATGNSTFARAAELTTTATISVRGSSSASFPKKAYTLTLRDS